MSGEIELLTQRTLTHVVGHDASGLAGRAALGTVSPTALALGMPVPPQMWPMGDAIDGNYTQFNLKAYATGQMLNFQQGYGVMGGAPSLCSGVGNSVIISHRGRPQLGSFSGNDNAGTALADHAVVAFPMVTRSGAARFYQAVTKRASTGSNVTTNAGYALGLYWTGTKTVIAFLLQGATAANYMLAIGTTDIPNFKAVMLSVQMTGAKTAASHELYVNGALETQDTPVSDTMGADSATNAGNYCIGGIGGTQTVDTNQGFSGALQNVVPLQTFRLSPAMQQAFYQMNNVGYVQPKTTGGLGTPLLFVTDPGFDIDDIFDLMMLIALHLRGEISLKGVVVTSSVSKAATVVEAMCRQAGLTIPIAAYKGSDRETTDSYCADVCTQFGYTKTAANYLDPQTLIRTVVRDNPGLIYCDVGPQQETSSFRQSAADATSPLTGMQLISNNVAATILSAGFYTTGSEYNNTHAPAAAADVALNWPKPITYVTIDVTTNISIPGNSDVSPSRKAYERYIINRIGGAEPNYNRQAFFPAVLWAVRGTKGGIMSIGKSGLVNTINASTGANSWGGTGTHSAVVLNSATNLLLAAESLLAECTMAGRDAFTLT